MSKAQNRYKFQCCRYWVRQIMTAKDIFYSLATWSLTPSPPLVFLPENEFGKVIIPQTQCLIFLSIWKLWQPEFYKNKTGNRYKLVACSEFIKLWPTKSYLTDWILILLVLPLPENESGEVTTSQTLYLTLKTNCMNQNIICLKTRKDTSFNVVGTEFVKLWLQKTYFIVWLHGVRPPPLFSWLKMSLA